jgi:hypothetical protein
VKGIAYSGRWFAKLHAYVFYVFRSTFKATWNDGWEDWKALLFTSVAAEFAGITIASIVSICLQRRVLLPHSKPDFLILWGALGFCLVILNYYILMFGHKWSRFEKEFKRPPKMNRVLGSVAVWVGLVLIVVASGWTGSIVWKLPPYG